jgi:hypothetical protein
LGTGSINAVDWELRSSKKSNRTIKPWKPNRNNETLVSNHHANPRAHSDTPGAWAAAATSSRRRIQGDLLSFFVVVFESGHFLFFFLKQGN